jgi:G3E family GTPase
VDTPPAPLPLILLTGFLGAGKTTLLLRWLSESPATGKRLGVVMNEFGAESVDSQLINRPGLPLQQVEGGCICCAADNELPNAVMRLVQEGACDYVVVETSGLSDPDNVIDVLTDPDLLPLVRLQAVVTIVDGVWYARPEMDFGERVLAKKQIQFAHVLAVSKCDRLGDAELEFVQAELRKLNPAAQFVKLPFGLPELGAILQRPSAQAALELASPGFEADASAASSPHLHTSYQSVTWRFPVPVDRSRFEEFLTKLDSREVVRAKGFVRFVRQPDRLFLFQSVFGHHFIEEFCARPAPEPVAVLIGPKLDAEKIRERLRTLAFGVGDGRLKLA